MPYCHFVGVVEGGMAIRIPGKAATTAEMEVDRAAVRQENGTHVLSGR
jgi:hypothetical protein